MLVKKKESYSRLIRITNTIEMESSLISSASSGQSDCDSIDQRGAAGAAKSVGGTFATAGQ